MAKVYYGGYGHNPNPNGKKYAYIGSDKYHVGENVVAPVTHYISGNNYKTMFTIQNQADMTSQQANDTIVMLENMRKTMKSLDGTNVMELPGAAKYPSAAAWKEAAKDRAEGRLVAAERLQTKNPVATETDFKVRQEQRLTGDYYERHQQYLKAMEQYRQKQEKERLSHLPSYEKAEAQKQAFERYKMGETDNKTFKREITQALTQYAPYDYYEFTDAEKGVDLFLENMKKSKQRAIDRLLSRR